MKKLTIAFACAFACVVLVALGADAQQPIAVKVVDQPVSVGTLASQILTWAAAVFSVPVGGALTLLLLRLFSNAGLVGVSLLKDQLQGIVVNAINGAAQAGAQALANGKWQIDLNQVVNNAASYVQIHGADILKKLGVDPNSALAVDAIKSRIATAIADPAVPTHPALAPAAPTSGPTPWPPATPPPTTK